MALKADQLERYSRNILLPGIGAPGQERLLGASVLCIGAGGLGAAVLAYLAAAGVGRIGIVDGDRLEPSNLNRQVIHTVADLGRLKAESAADRVRALNPDATVEVFAERFTRENARRLVGLFDAVVDASDNFPTRFLANDACFQAARPLFFGSAVAYEGQAMVFFANGPQGPCYRCLFPDLPPAGTAPAATEIGILGAVAGLIGAVQATECIKHLAGLGASLQGRLLLYDGLRMSFRRIEIHRNPDCALCGKK
jgi:adenylyltransferase/sulfurtransferase